MSKATIRARVAFYLAIAQKSFEELSKDDKGYLNTSEALDQCWSLLDYMTGLSSNTCKIQ
ncbi:Imm6 family immunity protein [Acetivibrio clariflavus]|uniref:Imm6 family immunity protein n=1 Tax=Acetivibrio clariflavus TaxID=288965 RepID=UPI0002D4FBEE|nr:Imm6 family immunity protein [Acetivibrio clariflavus]